MATMFTFKLKHTVGSDSLVRRLTFPVRPLWPLLASRVEQLFFIPYKEVALAYIDEDNDEIVISSEEELAHYFEASNSYWFSYQQPGRFGWHSSPDAVGPTPFGYPSSRSGPPGVRCLKVIDLGYLRYNTTYYRRYLPENLSNPSGVWGDIYATPETKLPAVMKVHTPEVVSPAAVSPDIKELDILSDIDDDLSEKIQVPATIPATKGGKNKLQTADDADPILPAEKYPAVYTPDLGCFPPPGYMPMMDEFAGVKKHPMYPAVDPVSGLLPNPVLSPPIRYSTPSYSPYRSGSGSRSRSRSGSRSHRRHRTPYRSRSRSRSHSRSRRSRSRSPRPWIWGSNPNQNYAPPTHHPWAITPSGIYKPQPPILEERSNRAQFANAYPMEPVFPIGIPPAAAGMGIWNSISNKNKNGTKTKKEPRSVGLVPTRPDRPEKNGVRVPPGLVYPPAILLDGDDDKKDVDVDIKKALLPGINQLTQAISSLNMRLDGAKPI